MNILAFDTSTEVMSVAVQRGGQVWQHHAPGGAQTSTHLIPTIENLMAQSGLRYAQLDAIAFGCGPGSFTGLRTACAVAQGLAFGADILVLPVDTLLAVAEEARQLHAAELECWQTWALLDARMDEMYAARYQFDSDRWTQIGGCSLICPESLAVEEGCALAGNVFATYGRRLASGSLACIPALPTATAMLRLAPALLAAGAAVCPDQALPIYIRDKVAKTTLERAQEKAAQ